MFVRAQRRRRSRDAPGAAVDEDDDVAVAGEIRSRGADDGIVAE